VQPKLGGWKASSQQQGGSDNHNLHDRLHRDSQSNGRNTPCSIAKCCSIPHPVRVIARLVVSTVACAVQLIGFLCD
jgi:hypothetical protein